ncbi:DUF2484 family protein [Defluviimonas sp. WL0002]|uniref:DUF2484 family protein n=1 Tax=Albidovulum marisflavi TaxID=2984159 RepID=A0ABT2ZDE7_9RHOB|nr:DUF2484 family protein [Defluviimonas sp. WL0002]MCV2869147.1 DUF2484 family protein [Defluviimonas sp. WL0002]
MTLQILICAWVIMATLTAFLPMRRQVVPGVFLLLAAPVLIVLATLDYGVWAGIAATVGFVSMFRRPLFFLARRALTRVRG